MNPGKHKCETLKSIRRQIAEQYDLTYNPKECTHEGDCPGTCPLCDAELRDLQRQLDEKGISGVDVNETTEIPFTSKIQVCLREPLIAGMPHRPYLHRYPDEYQLLKECPIANLDISYLSNHWYDILLDPEITLVRQKEYKENPNAAAVAISLDYTTFSSSSHILGYLPDSINKCIAKMLDMGRELECEISKIVGNNPDKCRIFIKIYRVIDQ